MTESKTYNGYTNRDTWLVNLWFETSFMALAEQYVRDEMLTAEDKEDFQHVRNLAENFCSLVEDAIEVDRTYDGYVKDIIQSTLQCINYHELAEDYLGDALPKEY